MTIEEKAKAYDEAIIKAKELYNQGLINPPLEYIFPEFAESKDEKIRKEILEVAKTVVLRDGTLYGKKYNCKDWIAWLEKQCNKNPVEEYNDEDYGIDEGKAEMDYCFTKMMNGEKVSSTCSEEDEEEINDEDYGIDGLWHAQRILEKTLGDIDGYQSDDGILEHKCAISAVKKLYEQKPAWSEEDEKKLIKVISIVQNVSSYDNQLDEYIKWLKFIKQRII